MCRTGRALVVLAVASAALAMLLSAPAHAVCGTKRYCTEMASCAEAYHHYATCGLQRLDGDNDGIPCEALCGKTIEQMRARIAATPFVAPAEGVGAAAPLAPGKGPGEAGIAPPATFACGAKRTCREMTSCEEARFHLQRCGNRRLDADGDGVPCEGLCR